MLYVSIFVELLRSRPALAVWLAAIAQALLWTLVPTLFYAGPPGDVPNVLAVGHEFQLGTYLVPPLAFWLAELAFDLAGRNLAAIYLLSQACVVVTYWAVFALASSIVGAQHAALAVLSLLSTAVVDVAAESSSPPQAEKVMAATSTHAATPWNGFRVMAAMIGGQPRPRL